MFARRIDEIAKSYPSLAAMWKATGVARPTLHAWRNGSLKSLPDGDQLAAFALKTGKSIDWLLGLPGAREDRTCQFDQPLAKALSLRVAQALLADRDSDRLYIKDIADFLCATISERRGADGRAELDFPAPEKLLDRVIAWARETLASSSRDAEDSERAAAFKEIRRLRRRLGHLNRKRTSSRSRGRRSSVEADDAITAGEAKDLLFNAALAPLSAQAHAAIRRVAEAIDTARLISVERKRDLERLSRAADRVPLRAPRSRPTNKKRSQKESVAPEDRRDAEALVLLTDREKDRMRQPRERRSNDYNLSSEGVLLRGSLIENEGAPVRRRS